jgi:ABC-type lipoprotein release transport system permease subunit
MGLFLTLAWRNLWRNKRRTIISIASVVTAVVVSLVFNSMQLGSNELLVDSVVGVYTGYLQVTGRDYWEKRSLDESMEADSILRALVERTEHVGRTTVRLESFALVSRGTATKISPVVGIDPEREDGITGLRKKLIAGSYLTPASGGVLLAEGLARGLGAGVGDSVVLYGQGYRGAMAASILPVAGIIRYPVPEMNKAMVVMSLAAAQELYAAPDRWTGIVVMIDEPDALEDVARALRSLAGEKRDVLTWEEMMPEVVQSVDVNNAGTVLMLVILYVVIGFGIFGTIMMMTMERTREFGVLIGIGMKRWKLIAVTAVESLLVSVVGALVGVAAGFPILWYLHFHPILLTGAYAEAMLVYGMEPILPFSLAPVNFIIQAAVVGAFGLLSALYPLAVIRRLAPVRAIRE